MAHHLIAVLFPSVRYTTSLWMKTTHSVQQHNRSSLFHISNTFISLSKCFFLGPLLPPCHSSLCTVFFPSMCLHCSASVLNPPLLILFPWLVLSLVQMSLWSAVAWLGDNRSDFETGGKAALLSLTQSYTDEPSTAKVRQREEK